MNEHGASPEYACARAAAANVRADGCVPPLQRARVNDCDVRRCDHDGVHALSPYVHARGRAFQRPRNKQRPDTCAEVEQRGQKNRLVQFNPAQFSPV